MIKSFTKDHEWIAVDGDIATVGITRYAQEQLGDVVYVELPEIGRHVARGGEAAVVESVKAASDVFAPVTGEIIAVNDRLADTPQQVNEDPEGGAWFFKVRLADANETADLMDEAAYTMYVEGL